MKPQSQIMLDYTQLKPPAERIEFPSDMTAEAFLEYCIAYKHLGVRIERNPDGSIVMEPPAGYESDQFESEVGFALRLWNREQTIVEGRVSGPSAGFILSNGAIRAADAAWVSLQKIRQFSAEERQKFLPVCPEFVVEILSPSDNMQEAKAKMKEWIANGALLAWLIDPPQEKAWIYRANGTVEEVVGFDDPLSGERVLPGFTFALDSLRFPSP